MSLDLSARIIAVIPADAAGPARAVVRHLAGLGASATLAEASGDGGGPAASGGADHDPGAFDPARVRPALAEIAAARGGVHAVVIVASAGCSQNAEALADQAALVLAEHSGGVIVNILLADARFPASQNPDHRAATARFSVPQSPVTVRTHTVDAPATAAEAAADLAAFLVLDTPGAAALSGQTLTVRDPRPAAVPAPDAVVVVGMGLAVPGASSPEEFWTLLHDDSPVFGEPGDRMDIDHLWSADAAAEDRTYSRVAGFMTGFTPHPRLSAEIDSGVLGPAESTALWLRHSLLQATEKVTVRDGDRRLFAVGLTPDGSQYLEESVVAAGVRGILADAGVAVPAALHTALPLASAEPQDFLPYRIARAAAHDLPADTEIAVVDTACSSSLYSIDIGVRALRDGEADIALCGGAFALTAQTMVLFAKLHGLSRSGRVRSLDRAADGVLFSDGAAILALKTYARAVADGDEVLGFVAGFGGSSDGRGKAIYAPNPDGQVTALNRAWAAAGVRPGEVDWIVAHATGTPTGDRTEMTALARAAGDSRPDQPWTMTSNKSLVGHSGWAAGAVSAIHALLALRYGAIPGQTAFDALPDGVGDAIDVPVGETPWPARTGRPRLVGVSAMGFGGTNGHLLLSDQPVGTSTASPDTHMRDADDGVSETSPSGGAEPVVIVGTAVHLPGDPDPARIARWLSGEPADWPAGFGSYPLPSPFEARMAPSALAATDRSQLMAMRCADLLSGEWARDAALTARTGVFVGHSGPTPSSLGYGLRCYLPALTAKVTRPAGLPDDLLAGAVRAKVPSANEDAYPGLMPNIIAARVAQRLDLHGPNMTLDAGRDSTHAALATAVRRLRGGELDLALIIGVNATTEYVRDPYGRPPTEAAVGFLAARLSVARQLGLPVLGTLTVNVPAPAIADTPALTPADPPAADREPRAYRGAEGAIALLRALHRTAVGVLAPVEDLHTPGLIVTPGDPDDVREPDGPGSAARPGSLAGSLSRHALVLTDRPAEPVRDAVAALPPGVLVLTDDPAGLAGAGLPADALVITPTSAPDPATQPGAGAGAPVVRLDDAAGLAEVLRADGRTFSQVRVIVSGRRNEAEGALPQSLLDLNDLSFTAGQACADALRAGGCHATVVLDAIDGAIPLPYSGLFSAVARNLDRELPGCTVFALVTETADLAVALGLLAAESSADRLLPVVYHSAGRRRQLVLAPVPGTGPTPGLGLPEDPVVVATDGARGLTAHLVEVIAQARRPRSVWLLGSSPAPARGHAEPLPPKRDALRRWLAEDPSQSLARLSERYACAVHERERADTLRSMERLCAPGRVHYRECDVLDEVRVRMVIDEIVGTEGRIDVLVHGAGLSRTAVLDRKRMPDFRAVRDVKVRGYRHLKDALAGREPRLWCSISSVSAFTGLLGEPDYSAGNEFLVLAGAQARAAGGDEVALVSGLWTESGMASADTPGGAFLARQGEIGQLTDEQGREFFRAELAGRGEHGLATTWIGELDWSTLHRQAPGLRPAGELPAAPAPLRSRGPRRAFLAEPARQDGDTAGWTTVIDLDHHPYLLDHLVDDRPTVPGTFLLELGAEAAVQLGGGLRPAGIRDVVLSRFVRAARHRWPRTLSVTATRTGDEVKVLISSPAAGPVPEREHCRMTVTLARVLPAGPAVPPPPPGGGPAPDTYRLDGSPVRLDGIFGALHGHRREPDGGSAALRLDLTPADGPFDAFVLPSVALDCLLRSTVLDGRRPGPVPVMVPTALSRIDLHTAFNDLELPRAWGDTLTLRHWYDAATGSEHCAVVTPGGRALLTATGVGGHELGRYDAQAGGWAQPAPAAPTIPGTPGTTHHEEK